MAPAQPSLLIGLVLLAFSAAGLKSPSAAEPALAIGLDVPAPQDSAGGTIVADVNDDRKPDLLAKQRDVWNLRASLTWRGSLSHLDAVSRRISLTIRGKWVSAAAVGTRRARVHRSAVVLLDRCGPQLILQIVTIPANVISQQTRSQTARMPAGGLELKLQGDRAMAIARPSGGRTEG
jgi:hypothetical protein